MTPEQMVAQYKRDAEQFKAKLPYMCSAINRDLKKQKTFPYRRIITWRSALGNDYFIKLVFRSRHVRSENSAAQVNMFAVMNFSDGAYLFDGSSACIDYNRWFEGILYKPHFFKRYAQRFGLDNGQGVIKQFLLRLHDATISRCQLTEAHGDGFDVMVISNDGLLLGTCENKFITIRTFLTIEQLNSKQYANANDEAKNILDCYETISSLQPKAEIVYAK